MKYSVTVVVESIYRGDIEADNKEEAYQKMADELSYYYNFEDILKFCDESINMYFDEVQERTV